MTGERTLAAHAIAAPVLDKIVAYGARDGGRTGEVWGATTGAAYLALDGFIVSLTGRGTPLMPNAVSTAGAGGELRTFARGSRVRFGSGRIGAAGTTLVWDPACPPCWDPTVPAAPVFLGDMCGRADALWWLLGIEPSVATDHARLLPALDARGLALGEKPGGRHGFGLLLRSLTARDPALAGEGAELLAGRGPGLTPEGDDVLSGCAATLAALGRGAGWSPTEIAGWRAALGAHGARTTELSRTLLALALDGQAPEPVHRLLDFSAAGERAVPGALARLLRLGHSTGLALAVAVTATLGRLGLK